MGSKLLFYLLLTCNGAELQITGSEALCLLEPGGLMGSAGGMGAGRGDPRCSSVIEQSMEEPLCPLEWPPSFLPDRGARAALAPSAVH